MSGIRRRWAELRKEGWTSKRPIKLETEHSYLRPGKSKKDVRGVDYFVGSEELMGYLDNLEKGIDLDLCMRCMLILDEVRSQRNVDAEFATESVKTAEVNPTLPFLVDVPGFSAQFEADSPHSAHEGAVTVDKLASIKTGDFGEFYRV
ncbi:Hypothetical protein PHPALM_6093 [Phytophthora palmivora]|uniref:Uncharacterized protein n=1 Tax=Phytophthora palmivora TaxID=4796 RepID=A0A2P4YFP7_9STRA|nr:Hypothetical protein PHPALM_6093 [Phytophthora palmivora]